MGSAMFILYICINNPLIYRKMNPFVILGVIGPWQIVLIIAVVLLLFGGKKIPELMRGIGKGAREFKKGLSGEEEEEEKKKNTPEKTE